MKKGLAVLTGILAIGMLSGCGTKTLVCTNSEDDAEEKITVKYNDEKVLSVAEEIVYSYDDDDDFDIDYAVELMEELFTGYDDIEGVDFSVEKDSDTSVKIYMSVDYEKLDYDAMSELAGDDDIFSRKNITIDEFREESLDGYDCK